MEQKPYISIVLPTFNERGNVRPIVDEIGKALEFNGPDFEIIFVDDSKDDTPKIIEEMSANDSRIKLIHREGELCTGLGTAVLEGILAAKSDVVCTMDSDLQHPPAVIPKMFSRIREGDVNFVVASRLVEGGSDEGLSGWHRKFVSAASRKVAHLFLPLTRKTSDPMTGFFMLEKSIVNNGQFEPIGFKILVEILAKNPEARVADIPFEMRKRENDASKASLKEGYNFLKHILTLVFATEEDSIIGEIKNVLSWMFSKSVIALTIVLGLVGTLFLLQFSNGVFETFILLISLFLSLQLTYTIFIQIYAWDHPRRIQENSSPKEYLTPTKSFTAIVPALNEASVIPDTIRAVAGINYPEELKETLVVLRDTDSETIAAAEKTLKELNKENVRIHLISGEPFNKPHHLNAALTLAKNDVVCIFDAEDEPHKEIYNVVNTVMVRDGADVVQSGVQLMNFESNWYSLFNVLEYYLWFGSALHFYEKQGVIPLGGNTVFFNTEMVREVGGWDMHGLTEDAEIGIRLSAHGAKIRVVYDAEHATREETPPTLKSFVKQRTRWSQGFMQILAQRSVRSDIKELGAKRTALIWYILGWPAVHACLFVYLPVALLMSLFVKTHPVVTIVNVIPVLLLCVFLLIQNVALFEFTKIYGKKWHPGYIFKTVVWFLPYQFALSFSSFRAMVRQFKQQTSWEKTEHVNAHRIATAKK